MHDSVRLIQKISIIIPTLNEEKLLKRLLSQFNPEIKKKYDVELIISDGGSQDSTIKIAEEYADRLILHKEKYPQNISQGRNDGAKNSLGDVLIFLNADTYVGDLDYLLSEILNEFQERDVSAIACAVYVFPDEEKFLDKVIHNIYNYYTVLLNKYFIGMGRGECQIIKRDKFFQVGGYNENLIAGEDFDLYKRLGKDSRVVFRSDLIVYESPRRYRKFGYIRVLWDWAKNSVAIILANKSVSKKWEPVR